MSRARWLIAWAIVTMAGCPSPEPGDDGSASTTDGDGGSTNGDGGSTAGGSGPTGSCPLEGMFVECVDAGIGYCDEIDGELQWGPCVVTPECELGEDLVGCQRCTLEGGVPTVTGSPTCECEGPAGAAVCEQTECLQRWDYDCGLCESFVSGDCFSYDQGCASPWLGCGTGEPSPCGRVWAQDGEFGTLGALEDEAAAVCVLESLRDGIPGTYDIVWGFMDDSGWVSEQVHTGGDGTAVVEWQYDCPGCTNSGSLGRSGTLSLRDAAWFDDCLADPTVERLIECLVGLTEYQPGQPPPVGYVPPFVTGECVSLEAACP